MNTYTTGQIIDILKPGQKAKCIDGDYVGECIERRDRGIYFVYPEHLQITASTLQAKWQLAPQYVTFVEAIQALDEGKTVLLHHEGNEVEYAFGLTTQFTRLYVDNIEMHELINGKWSIVEEDAE